MTSEDLGLPLSWLRAQPYEEWAEARRAECPVRTSRDLSMGPSATYQVLSYREAETVLRDAETFSSTINAQHIGQFMGDLILAMDGGEHRQYRNLVAKAFRASQLERWDDTLVRPTIDRLCDEIAPADADLVEAITSKYPVQVICGIVGVPLEDALQFHRWAEEINTGPLNPPRGHAASQAMVDYLRPLIEARAGNPVDDDFLSDLVHAEVDGETLSDDKLYGFLRLLLPAGAETTFRVMGNCLFALLAHPDVLKEVYGNRELIPEVIEETLRWETSVTMVSRVAAHDVEVAGCPIAAGSPVGVITGSANRDESRWDDADQWRLGRPVQHHLAFGTGPHQCLGMHLARLELRVGLDVLLDRLPNLRLDPDADTDGVVIEGQAFRGPRALPVTFDPS